MVGIWNFLLKWSLFFGTFVHFFFFLGGGYDHVFFFLGSGVPDIFASHNGNPPVTTFRLLFQGWRGMSRLLDSFSGHICCIYYILSLLLLLDMNNSIHIQYIYYTIIYIYICCFWFTITVYIYICIYIHIYNIMPDITHAAAAQYFIYLFPFFDATFATTPFVPRGDPLRTGVDILTGPSVMQFTWIRRPGWVEWVWWV